MAIVYRYYLFPPTEGADIVREQMRRAHRYYNTLIEIERGRRAAIRALDGEHFVELAAKVTAGEQAVEAALLAVKADRAATRRRSASEPATAALKAAREALREAKSALREARKAQAKNAAFINAADTINELAGGLRRNARAFCNVYSGTYLLVEAAVQAACSGPQEPKFARWKGEGRVGVQLQGGLTINALHACEDTRLRVRPVPEGTFGREGARDRFARGVPRRQQRTEVRMRVASDARAPVWATWPLRLHRPLPDNARITWAAVHVERVEAHERWSLLLTVDTAARQRDHANDSMVALDLGWRAVGPDNIRVATTYDGASCATLVLDGMNRRLDKADDLRSIRDKLFDLARPWVRQLLDGLSCPEWLRAALTHMWRWRSAPRLAALALRWREERFAGDEYAYAGLEAWRQRDKHLWTWETHQRRKAAAYRKQVFRSYARNLANRYKWLVLEGEFDLRTFGERDPDAASGEGRRLREHMRRAAPGELREALKHAFGFYVIEAKTANTTRRCNDCGHTEAWDAAADIWHACPKCGVVWDQDENAGRNLYERGSNALPTEIARVTTKLAELRTKKPSRWAKVKALRAEKEARMAAARNASDKAAE